MGTTLHGPLCSPEAFVYPLLPETQRDVPGSLSHWGPAGRVQPMSALWACAHVSSIALFLRTFMQYFNR